VQLYIGKKNEKAELCHRGCYPELPSDRRWVPSHLPRNADKGINQPNSAEFSNAFFQNVLQRWGASKPAAANQVLHRLS
jgi:hypothetical protein